MARSLAKTARVQRTYARQRDDAFAGTDLARLCRYYLACLGYEDAGVSVAVKPKEGDPIYVEVNQIPRSQYDFADSDAGRKLLGRRRTERGRYDLYFGYPIVISAQQSRQSNAGNFMVEPLLLFPIEQEKTTGRLAVDLSIPIINQKPLRSFTKVENDMLMDERLRLEQELGLDGDGKRPTIDEIAARLQAARPEWPWREEINASLPGQSLEPMDWIDKPGIYNRAVMIMALKSPFTQGLEKELHDLALLSENEYAHTALGKWLLGNDAGPAALQPAKPLLEALPMNLEQRQAVAAALTRPVTVITGPPGTGKSQIIVNLLINAAYSGKRILFTSKNNKAVDVVEARANAIGPRPTLLRTGAQAYQTRFAEYVLALLSTTTSAFEREEFAEAEAGHEKLRQQHQNLAEKVQNCIDLRNKVDQLEQLAEPARLVLGPALFAGATGLDLHAIKGIVKMVGNQVEQADRSAAPFFARLIWPIILGQRRFRALCDLLVASEKSFMKIGLRLPATAIQESDLQKIKDTVQRALSNLLELEKAAAYQKSLRDLQAAQSLEEIAREEAALRDQIARHSERLWQFWLRIQPSTLSAEERKKLGKYSTLLKMVVNTGDQGRLTKEAYRQYQSFLSETSRLFPCQAVTSLSARGRIPFVPEMFDIVVFDEASQCDIASALPLLYRAKSVVIIGDVKQLSHITTLLRGQDQDLLEKYDLFKDWLHWSYAHQSLFDLGTVQASGEDMINLIDHHRSHADIIQFANNEFYEKRLRVATKYDHLKMPGPMQPGIRWIDIKGRVVRPPNGGAVNNQEANAVVATLRSLLLEKRYEGSVGVVTPFRAQADAITKAVNRDSELVSALLRHDFLADTVHKFQGDERDIMIFSPVLSAQMPPGALHFLGSNGNLFNVAITRARAQLIIVGDLVACGASEIGYLARCAAYTAALADPIEEDDPGQPGSDIGPVYPTMARSEPIPDWEKKFYAAAYEAGIQLIPQYRIEKYIVDFLLDDGKRKLVIEIDGEQYHRNWTGELCRRDQIRNQRLFELGFDVLRFWVYEVRDDLDFCLRRVHNWKSSSMEESARR